MRDELLYLYERELNFLRRTGAEFAQRYPKVASRLQLEANKCDDPHVERLLEGFAFLAARVHMKLEDELPEVSEALLEVVYPHYTRPIPSMSVVQFHLDPEQGKLSTGWRIEAHKPLYSKPVGGVPCRFRTCYETTLWPVRVAAAAWSAPHELSPPVRSTAAVGALRLELDCFADGGFAQLDLETLRLYLDVEANLASTLYELLCNSCLQILVRDPTPGSRVEPVVLPASALRPVGFGPDEGILPFSRRSFLGYRLLQEYFTFPEKFFFLDLSGFDRVRAAGFGARAEVVFLISPFERPERRPMLQTGVSRDTFQLGCTPVVNLFPQTSEPILLNQRRPDYLLIPDARRRAAVGVFSVDQVVAASPGATQTLTFEPLYSFRHDRPDGGRFFWHARREPTGWRPDEGTDVYLSFVDHSSRTVYPDLDAVTARLTCFNGDLPSRLPFGDPGGDFEMPGGGPVQRIVARIKPTSVIHPPLGKAQLWRLISQLSLNYLSLVSGGGEALREVLRLHNFGDSAGGEKQIQGILDVRGSSAFSRIESEHGLTFARGQRVEVDFDEEQFAGGGVYLLASVLHHFLGHSVSLNSFCILAARTRQRKGPLAEWPPRAGWKTLL
jgi:type VI secretion system protein ImpG